MQSVSRPNSSSSFSFFFVDFADAVFDLILSTRTMMFGNEGDGAGFGLGLLLFIATILGRVVSAIYGWRVSRYPPDEEVAFVRFAFMEMVVFFLEDGAAILVLANNTGGMTIVETISMYLTIICGVCYFVLFVLGLIRRGMVQRWIALVFALSTAFSVIFQVHVLITKVILSKDDDPLSGKLERSAFTMYGGTALLMVNLFFSLTFCVNDADY